MIKSLSFALALAAALAAASPILAQDTHRPAPEAEDVTRYTFTDQHVPGATTGPWVDRLQGRRVIPTRTLIQPRLHFRPELLKSVERL